MPLFEVFIKPGFHSADVEADSAERAKEIFVQMIQDNIGTDQIEANNLDEDENEKDIGFPILPIPKKE